MGPSVRPSVHPSVRPSVRPIFFSSSSSFYLPFLLSHSPVFPFPSNLLFFFFINLSSVSSFTFACLPLPVQSSFLLLHQFIFCFFFHIRLSSPSRPIFFSSSSSIYLPFLLSHLPVFPSPHTVWD